MKRYPVGLCMVATTLLLSGCVNDTSPETVKYANAEQGLSYGYIEMDFRKARDLEYGKDYVKGKASYTVMYVNKDDVKFIEVKDAPFEDKILKAYIPYYEGWDFRHVDRAIFLPACVGCDRPPQMNFISTYSVEQLEGTWCPETVFHNHETYNYETGCPKIRQDREYGAHGLRGILGDVTITPHFRENLGITFTHRDAPDWASIEP